MSTARVYYTCQFHPNLLTLPDDFSQVGRFTQWQQYRVHPQVSCCCVLCCSRNFCWCYCCRNCVVLCRIIIVAVVFSCCYWDSAFILPRILHCFCWCCLGCVLLFDDIAVVDIIFVGGYYRSDNIVIVISLCGCCCYLCLCCTDVSAIIGVGLFTGPLLLICYKFCCWFILWMASVLFSFLMLVFEGIGLVYSISDITWHFYSFNKILLLRSRY